MRKLKCRVCGWKFRIDKQKVEIVSETQNLNDKVYSRVKYYDAVDCPHCGCQRKLAERLTR